MDQSGTETAQPVETYESVSSLLDYVLLRPDLSADELDEACGVAREYAVRAIVVRPCDVQTVLRWMSGSGIIVAAAVGYPYGYSTTAAKLYEGRDLLRLGAKELDFTVNASRLISRQFQDVETELMQIVKSCHEDGAIAKIVLNNRFLADDLKIIATKIFKRVEADMMSIDYREADVGLLKPLLRDVLRLKCTGPADRLGEVLTMREQGFVRIGCTNPRGVLEDWKKKLVEQTQPPPTP